MKRIILTAVILSLLFSFGGCSTEEHSRQITATTAPVFEFTQRLCQNTDIHVTQLITENVSCLHDYTLQVSQMKLIESSDLIIINGAGLEDFLQDAFPDCERTVDSSANIELLCNTDKHTEHDHDHDHDHDHHSDKDPHIWLSPENAKFMVQNIYDALCRYAPEYQDVFSSNLTALLSEIDKLIAYGNDALCDLNHRDIITFHDGFSYMAHAYDLHIVKSIEEESGSESSASELIAICKLVDQYSMTAIFTETNNSASAAKIIARETGCKIYTLDMAMSENSYFDAMYHNIDTLKEALG